MVAVARAIVVAPPPPGPRTEYKTAFPLRFSIWILLPVISILVTSRCTIPVRFEERVRVERVIDGDTLVLEDGRRVRLLGLDAPELGYGGSESECYAPESKAFLELIVGQAKGEFSLEYDEIRFDRYNRTLAYIWNGKNRMLNEIILREGYAVFRAGDAVRWLERLRQAEAEARLARRGLWHPAVCP